MQLEYRSVRTSFAVPDELEPVTRHPKVTPPGEEMRYHHALCYGCGADAVNGLHVRVTAGEGATSTATMSVPQWMEGGPGVIHGGLLSAAFDEVMGTTALLIGVPVVTGHLEIDFAKPIPIGSSLWFTGEVLGRVGRKIYMRSKHSSSTRMGRSRPTRNRSREACRCSSESIRANTSPLTSPIRSVPTPGRSTRVRKRCAVVSGR